MHFSCFRERERERERKRKSDIHVNKEFFEINEKSDSLASMSRQRAAAPASLREAATMEELLLSPSAARDWPGLFAHSIDDRQDSSEDDEEEEVAAGERLQPGLGIVELVPREAWDTSDDDDSTDVDELFDKLDSLQVRATLGPRPCQHCNKKKTSSEKEADDKNKVEHDNKNHVIVQREEKVEVCAGAVNDVDDHDDFIREAEHDYARRPAATVEGADGQTRSTRTNGGVVLLRETRRPPEPVGQRRHCLDEVNISPRVDLDTSDLPYPGGPQQQGLHRGRQVRVMQTEAGTCEPSFVHVADELLEEDGNESNEEDTMLPDILESVGLAWARSAQVLERGLLAAKRANKTKNKDLNSKKKKKNNKMKKKKEVWVVRALGDKRSSEDNNNKIVLHKSSPPRAKNEDSC